MIEDGGRTKFIKYALTESVNGSFKGSDTLIKISYPSLARIVQFIQYMAISQA